MSGQAIIEAETKWARAILTHDVERLKLLIHPTFVFLGLRSAGVQAWTRAQWASAVMKIEFRALEHTVRDLQVFGSTAVATIDGRWSAVVGGSTLDELFMMTDVWNKAPNGPWRVVRRHSTRYVEDETTREPLDVPALTLDI